MKTLHFGVQRAYGLIRALHIYEDENGEVQVTASVATCMDVRNLNNSTVLDPPNEKIIRLCEEARSAGFRVKIPKPDYPIYDMLEDEFLQRAAMLEPFPTVDGGIVWNNSQLGIPMHQENVSEGEDEETREYYSRPYTDVRRKDGTIVRVRWRNQGVYKNPRLCEGDLDEMETPEDLKYLILQRQEEILRAQKKADQERFLRNLKKRLEEAGIPYQE